MCFEFGGAVVPENATWWMVLRTDDSGNVFLVQDELDGQSASALVDTLTARGHKQTYSAHPYSGRIERADLLSRLRVEI